MDGDIICNPNPGLFTWLYSYFRTEQCIGSASGVHWKCIRSAWRVHRCSMVYAGSGMGEVTVKYWPHYPEG
ncbi:hypothetical protein QFZ48_002685 [Chitinophaga sp. W2I13]